MTARPRRHDGDTRTARELLRLARRELDHIDAQLAWRESELDGIRVEETVGSGSNIASDPTMGQASSRTFVAGKIDRARERLVPLVDATLPSIFGVLRVDDERPRESDQHTVDRHTGQPAGAADLSGGLSAYRGDRKVPAGRPDLKESLDAQRRRIDRGEGHGRG